MPAAVRSFFVLGISWPHLQEASWIQKLATTKKRKLGRILQFQFNLLLTDVTGKKLEALQAYMS
jgi:hypothetical protein